MAVLLIPQGGALRFGSPGDEAAFFAWLESIPGVRNINGEGRKLVVTLRSSSLSDRALQELIALHSRYGLPLRPLAKFETPRNRAWLRARDAFWYRQMFGRAL